MLVNDLTLLLDLFGNSEETKLLICKAIFVWCLQRHRNGGLNSGQKSAIIVTDAYLKSLCGKGGGGWSGMMWGLGFPPYSLFHIVQITDFLKFHREYCKEKSETFTKF